MWKNDLKSISAEINTNIYFFMIHNIFNRRILLIMMLRLLIDIIYGLIISVFLKDSRARLAEKAVTNTRKMKNCMSK